MLELQVDGLTSSSRNMRARTGWPLDLRKAIRPAMIVFMAPKIVIKTLLESDAKNIGLHISEQFIQGCHWSLSLRTSQSCQSGSKYYLREEQAVGKCRREQVCESLRPPVCGSSVV